MSMFLEYKGKFYSFSKYVTLTEALSPNRILYGTNPLEGKSPKNLEFIHMDGDGSFPKKLKYLKSKGAFYSTWFEFKDKLFWVGIDKFGECAFAQFLGKSEGENYNKTYDSKDILNIAEFYTMDNTNSTVAFKIFGNVIFVLMEMANKLNINEIKFEGYNAPLGKFYRLLTTNKLFNKSLNKFGWKYDRTEEETYFYSRV